MNISGIIDALLKNAMTARIIAPQVGVPESFVDTAISIIQGSRAANPDQATADNLAAFQLLQEFKKTRAEEFEKKPNQLLVQCKACSTINRVTMQ